jgi:hypothetical protein
MGRKKENMEKYKYKLLTILVKHVGSANAIKMPVLHEEVFGEPPKTKISGTRKLRYLINDLRKEGNPICSSSNKDNPGYYIAAAGSELENFLKRIRMRALKVLKLESTIRKIALPQLLNEITLNLEERRSKDE